MTTQAEALQDPLAELRDIHLPPAIEAWPPALGWWILALLSLAALVVAAHYLWTLWRKNAYRREAVARLREIYQVHNHDQQAFLVRFNELLKRVALTAYPREGVANLTGEAWVAFLDRSGGTHEFSMGPGQVLVDGQYMPVSTVDSQSLLNLGEQWIKRHDNSIAEWSDD